MAHEMRMGDSAEYPAALAKERSFFKLTPSPAPSARSASYRLAITQQQQPARAPKSVGPKAIGPKVAAEKLALMKGNEIFPTFNQGRLGYLTVAADIAGEHSPSFGCRWQDKVEGAPEPARGSTKTVFIDGVTRAVERRAPQAKDEHKPAGAPGFYLQPGVIYNAAGVPDKAAYRERLRQAAQARNSKSATARSGAMGAGQPGEPPTPSARAAWGDAAVTVTARSRGGTRTATTAAAPASRLAAFGRPSASRLAYQSENMQGGAQQACGDWAVVESRSKPGLLYYYNHKTEKTRWERPAGFLA